MSDDYIRDWHDKYVREVQRNHDLGLEVASLKARLDGLVDDIDTIRFMVGHLNIAPMTKAEFDTVFNRAIEAAKGEPR
jgi:hypothetical protein